MSLRGDLVKLVSVVPEQAPELFAAGHDGRDPALWTYLPYGPFTGVEEMRLWLSACAASEDPQFFAIVEQEGGRAAGMASYLRFAPDHRVVEIGHIWFGGELQRTPAATETIYLLSRHAFEELKVRRLEWKCDAGNDRSRRAAERLGFTFEGVFRQHMLVKDRTPTLLLDDREELRVLRRRAGGQPQAHLVDAGERPVGQVGPELGVAAVVAGGEQLGSVLGRHGHELDAVAAQAHGPVWRLTIPAGYDAAPVRAGKRCRRTHPFPRRGRPARVWRWSLPRRSDGSRSSPS